MYFYDDEEYRIEYVGNNTGTMDLTITEYDSDGEEQRNVCFYDVALSNGRTYTVGETKQTLNKNTYSLKEERGETVRPDLDTNNVTNLFTDVPSGSWYYDAVQWAVEQGITNGTGTNPPTFSPNNSCTRAQMATFLWRAAGSPKPKGSANPFTDVQPGTYYYDAVLWAVEQGITNGTSATTFSPDTIVTRAQTVTFLYRTANSPAVSGSNPFTDVPAGMYYSNAVQWAVGKGITNGTSATTFSPDADCTRGQIVTFLYRAMAE